MLKNHSGEWQSTNVGVMEYTLAPMSNSKPELTSHSTSSSLIRNAHKATVTSHTKALLRPCFFIVFLNVCNKQSGFIAHD